MKTPRPLKKLLQIMLDNMNLLRTGLCWLSNCLVRDNIISLEEMRIILDFIGEHPTEYYKTNLYYWPAGEKSPRIAFLKRHIKKLS